MRLNQKGFGAVEILIVIVVLTLIGFIGWTSLNNSTGSEQEADTTVVNEAEAKQEDISTPYSSEDFGISFEYPESWHLNESATEQQLTLGLATGSGLQDQLALTAFVRKDQALAATKSNSQNVFDGVSDKIDTSVEEGEYFGLSGYKFTHEYKSGEDPTFFTYVLDRQDAVIEFRITMSQFDFEEDQKIIEQVVEILEAAKLS